MFSVTQRIAQELTAQEYQVQAAIRLLDDGATVPFISRYRKEVTGGLDDTQLRTLEERLRYLRELDERREVIRNSIREQGKLTAELEILIQDADTKTRLEDLYLPYKPKRRTKAQIAKELGLEPLALELLNNPTVIPEVAAAVYINNEKGINDYKQALDGARQILMETFAEEADLLEKLREYVWENANFTAKVVEGMEEAGTKFSDYFDYQESIKEIPSHRALALFRGRKEGILQLSLAIDDNPSTADLSNTSSETPTHSANSSLCEHIIAQHFHLSNQNRPADAWLLETVRLAWRFKIRLHLDSELMTRLRETAETEAIKVFVSNLHDLLLAAPAGPRVTIGLDPGLRTGVKVAVIDNTGKLIDTSTLYPHPPHNQWHESIALLVAWIKKYQVELISIGNGTGSRETDKLVTELSKKHPDLGVHKVIVSEAGASVYSASELAAQEFPNLDVSLRGAVSIARRLQDPLAELVKIDPKSIGVGQYQHDVSQTQLARSLDAVVEDCVNAVGVDVNTASVSLLSRVSGLSANLARNIVAFRDENGPFSNRIIFRQVPRLGEKTFEQAAGFLRIMNGDNPLDASAVHPEAYPVVEQILAKHHKSLKEVIGNTPFLRNLMPEELTNEVFGIPTVTDILKELEKPGRDPRPEFKTAVFLEGVESLEDLQANMILEGVITNVTNFGAFVDVGVHQDGLIHISELSHSYVKDPREVVKAGEVVKVKVVEIDLKRRRVALSMKLENPRLAMLAKRREAFSLNNQPKAHAVVKPVERTPPPKKEPPKIEKKERQTAFMGAMAEAFANARKR